MDFLIQMMKKIKQHVILVNLIVKNVRGKRTIPFAQNVIMVLSPNIMIKMKL